MSIDEKLKNDLLAIAKGEILDVLPEELKLSSKESSIRHFITFKNIKEQQTPVPFRLIYECYVKWCTDRPVGVNVMGGILSKYFKRQSYKGTSCFFINPESVDLDKDYSMFKDTRFNNMKKEPKIKYLGVVWMFSHFVARFICEDGCHYLGRFKTQQEAAWRHDVAAYKYYGEKASLNFPEKISEIKAEEEKGYPSLRTTKLSGA